MLLQKRLHKLSLLISLAVISHKVSAVEFNVEVLSTEERGNIDLNAFAEPGYLYPGEYNFRITVNRTNVSSDDFSVMVFPDVQEKQKTQICLTKEIIHKIGFTNEALELVSYSTENACADLSEITGIEIKPVLGEGRLSIQVPTSWLEYSDATWSPSSHWDEGITGFILDYNISSTLTSYNHRDDADYTTYNGTAGFNYGAWRLRSDYQGYRQNSFTNKKSQSEDLSLSRVYAYKNIKPWRSTLSVGENYIFSDIFDSWKYIGFGLQSDDRMLPPKLRGYSQQITGIAETNAQVRVSQQGRVLYESSVPAGNFTISDLDTFIKGKLDVEIIEQNGKIKTFQVDTANVPFLTRPGQVRYKFSTGRPINYDHDVDGPGFVHTELSWGVNNHWSLYGGGVAAENYGAMSVGIGRDLFQYGALSADVTQSVASFKHDASQQGKSWRFSYSKEFSDINAELSFAGYRFSEEKFLTMNQFLAKSRNDDWFNREKELYTITFNKNITGLNTSLSTQYSYQTYWNSKERNYYSLSIHNSFDVLDYKHISTSLSLSRTDYNGQIDDAFYFRVSLPFSNGHLSYSNNISDNNISQQVGYSSYNKENSSSYSLNAGVNSEGSGNTQGTFSAYYSRPLKWSNISANVYSSEGNYTSFGASATGGITLTTKGGGLHSGGFNGSTRLLVDTNGVENITIDNGKVKTNRWGKGVLTNVPSYYRNRASVDVKKLPENTEAKRPVVEFVLTEGAIGYRKFEILKGIKLYANIRLSDHKYPPFGASVRNENGIEIGIVSDQGLAWITGVSPDEDMLIQWGNKSCKAKVPDVTSGSEVILPCI
ncbi:fimbria/pilus outer membrane usher protein [Citrobacter freundii]|nr:fimbria/pilus outer membrane usher protein [Citrobacter freundii]WFV09246.1 fimbria/pilus outer membrane usher protein [Citrobacter freundii]